MFLTYSASGNRDYAVRHHVHACCRKVWEFQIIARGSCLRLKREGPQTLEEALAGPTLVVSGPESVHGWYAHPGEKCSVVVFHFDDAQYNLRQIVGQSGYRCVHLSAANLSTIKALHQRCLEAKFLPDCLAFSLCEIVALELTLLFLSLIPQGELPVTTNPGRRKVIEAMAWYQANLAQGPHIEEVARAVHLSAAHLRRLFHKVRGMPPQAAFTHLQFDRARELMLDQALSLEQIAEQCGFRSASAFSRAFKSEFDISPLSYRTRYQVDISTTAAKLSK